MHSFIYLHLSHFQSSIEVRMFPIRSCRHLYLKNINISTVLIKYPFTGHRWSWVDRIFTILVILTRRDQLKMLQIGELSSFLLLPSEKKKLEYFANKCAIKSSVHRMWLGIRCAIMTLLILIADQIRTLFWISHMVQRYCHHIRHQQAPWHPIHNKSSWRLDTRLEASRQRTHHYPPEPGCVDTLVEVDFVESVTSDSRS